MMMQGKFNGRIFRDEDIIITKIIGQGNWSHVYEGFNTSKTRKYAVKVISEEKFRSTPKIRELTNAEINILKECNNPNVIKMHKSFSQEGHIFMVLDYCNQGDLGKLLEEEGTLPEPIALVYLKQILNGFRGLHEVKAMHRDFKVQNVMLHDNICKIVDLGFGKQLLMEGQVTKTKLGSNLTMAPEVMRRQPYSFQADIWSIGVVYYQMLEGTYPFKGTNMQKILDNIVSNQITFKKPQISEDSIDFIKRCLVVNPHERISWKKIYDHPLIANHRPEPLLNHSEQDLNFNAKFYDLNEKKKEFVPSAFEYFAHREEEEEEKERIHKEQSFQREKYQQPYQRQFQKFDPLRDLQKAISIYQLSPSQEQGKVQIPLHDENNKKMKDKNQKYKERVPNELQFERSSWQAEVEEKINEYWQYYLSQFNSLRYVPLVLLPRYEKIKIHIPQVQHELALALMIKDYSLKVQDLIESLEQEKDIFEARQYFPSFNFRFKQKLVNQFKSYLETEVEPTFKLYKLLADENMQKYSDPLDQVEMSSLETDNPNWNSYLNDHVRRYWMELSPYIPKTDIKDSLLIYIFCLFDFEKNNRNGTLSYKRIMKNINHFDYRKAEEFHKNKNYFTKQRFNNHNKYTQQERRITKGPDHPNHPKFVYLKKIYRQSVQRAQRYLSRRQKFGSN